jgi:hypothetical protein
VQVSLSLIMDDKGTVVHTEYVTGLLGGIKHLRVRMYKCRIRETASGGRFVSFEKDATYSGNRKEHEYDLAKLEFREYDLNHQGKNANLRYSMMDLTGDGHKIKLYFDSGAERENMRRFVCLVLL